MLVIDDDPSIRGLVTSSLRRLGVSCDSATDGFDALHAIEQTDYAVYIVDLMMPRVDGAAFIQSLREKEETSRGRPLVLLMTAFPAREIPELGPHVQAIIQKPFDIMDLAQLISDCVGSRSPHERDLRAANDQPPDRAR